MVRYMQILIHKDIFIYLFIYFCIKVIENNEKSAFYKVKLINQLSFEIDF